MSTRPASSSATRSSAFGGDPAAIVGEAYHRADVLGYLEVHIEQGPVLEQAGEPLGVVSAIASQGRYRLHVRGEAGHAGTVPMAIRHDALAAAAEVIVLTRKWPARRARHRWSRPSARSARCRAPATSSPAAPSSA